MPLPTILCVRSLFCHGLSRYAASSYRRFLRRPTAKPSKASTAKTAAPINIQFVWLAGCCAAAEVGGTLAGGVTTGAVVVLGGAADKVTDTAFDGSEVPSACTAST